MRTRTSCPDAGEAVAREDHSVGYCLDRDRLRAACIGRIRRAIEGVRNGHAVRVEPRPLRRSPSPSSRCRRGSRSPRSCRARCRPLDHGRRPRPCRCADQRHVRLVRRVVDLPDVRARRATTMVGSPEPGVTALTAAWIEVNWPGRPARRSARAGAGVRPAASPAAAAAGHGAANAAAPSTTSRRTWACARRRGHRLAVDRHVSSSKSEDVLRRARPGQSRDRDVVEPDRADLVGLVAPIAARRLAARGHRPVARVTSVTAGGNGAGPLAVP